MKKIGIIGAGLSGLAAAALLSKKGYRVEIFEREAVVGGRALTLDGRTLTKEDYLNRLQRFDMWIPFTEPSLDEIFKKGMLDGYRFDLGFHMLGFVGTSPVLSVLKRFGKKIHLLSSRMGWMLSTGEVISRLPFGLSLLEKIAFVYLLMRLRLLPKSTIAGLQEVPFSTILSTYSKGKIREIVDLSSRLIATTNKSDRISSGEAIRVMRRSGLKVKPAGYPQGGIQSLAQALAEIVLINNGKIHLLQKVDEIRIKNGRAKGLVVNGEEKPYDAVISTLPVQDLFHIASENVFPPHYVRTLKNLEGTGSVCAYYALQKKDRWPLFKPFTFVEKGLDVEGNSAAGVIDFQTADPHMGMSPQGCCLVQGYAICAPTEARDKSKVALLKEVLDNKLNVLLPGFREHLIFALYPTSYHLDGVAKTIHNIKPESLTPVENLYLAGDGVRSTGIGMNCAVDSALRLADMV